jgi:GntR family transcriptional regulator of vanillate catabolism
MEGLAARLAAERGVAPECWRGRAAWRGRRLLQQPALDDEAFTRYVALNQRFHNLLSEMAGSAVLARELERVVQPAVRLALRLRVVQANSPQRARHAGGRAGPAPAGAGRDRAREGARAEAIMREHSRLRAAQPARGRARRPPQPACGCRVVRAHRSTVDTRAVAIAKRHNC